jgi:transposase
MRGLPVELRERIIAAHVEQGIEVLEVAELFGVSHSSVRRYVAKAKNNESLVPDNPTGAPSKLGQKALSWLFKDLKANLFTTSYELTVRYNRHFHTNKVHRSTILRAMHQLGFTHKKRLP